MAMRGKVYRGPEKGSGGGKPPGRWGIFGKIKENYNEKSKKILILLSKIPIFL